MITINQDAEEKIKDKNIYPQITQITQIRDYGSLRENNKRIKIAHAKAQRE